MAQHEGSRVMSWRLDSKVALVTGGTSGIGWAVADEFLKLGATTCIVARNAEKVGQSVAAWRDNKLPAHGVTADVKTEDGRQDLMKELGKISARLDILVNNVGTNIRKKTMEFSPEDYRRSEEHTSELQS